MSKDFTFDTIPSPVTTEYANKLLKRVFKGNVVPIVSRGGRQFLATRLQDGNENVVFSFREEEGSDWVPIVTVTLTTPAIYIDRIYYGAADDVILLAWKVLSCW